MVNRPLVVFLKLLLVLTGVAVLALGIAVPLNDALYQTSFGERMAPAAVAAFIAVAGAMALWILAELYLVLNTALSDPFVTRNSLAFMRMGVVAEAAAALFFVKSAVSFTIMTVICGGVMLLCGLFAIALSQVFRRAVELKQENDLTI